MLDLLIKKLDFAFKTQWHDEIITKYEVFKSGEKIGLKFFKLDDNNCLYLIHLEEPVLLKNEDSVNDLISRGLSSFLKLHIKWKK